MATSPPMATPRKPKLPGVSSGKVSLVSSLSLPLLSLSPLSAVSPASIFFLLLSMDPKRLLADVTYQLEGPGVALGSNPTLTLEKIISMVIGLLTVVAFIYFAIQLILAGYAYIVSEGDKNKMETARRRLTEGIIGLIIIVVAVGLASLIATVTGLGNIFDLEALFVKLSL